MPNNNWIVTDDGLAQSFGSDEVEMPARTYRLYRFLSELEDILSDEPDDYQRVLRITPLVRKLLISSYWLQMEFDPPSAKTGWSVKFLYREFEFPLTVQMVAWAPGQVSTIHNHGTWGIVALIGGQEKNMLWRSAPSAEQTGATSGSPGPIQKVGEQLLSPGDIIGFTPGAIHAVEALGDEPTVSFNLYGVTDFKRRYQFDVEQQTAKRY
ncbi:MAG: cupin [Cyanobacteria bacterium P01_A01_bin.114]